MTMISFNSANYVAAQIGFNMTQGWGQGDTAANDYYSPISTFEGRFHTLLTQVGKLGFSAMDLWTGQLNYTWATKQHIEMAAWLLDKHKITLTSYAGGFGDTPEQLTKACEFCKALNIPVLGGGTRMLQKDRALLAKTLRNHGLQFGLENHPERSSDEVLAKIGDSDTDVLGIALDTGWFATQEYDVPTAIKEIGSRIKIVHLKDVKARRSEPSGFQMIDMGHETCALGDGIVNIKGCIDALQEIGYSGTISIEHEPEDFDPSEDVKVSKTRVEKWLKEDSFELSSEPALAAV